MRQYWNLWTTIYTTNYKLQTINLKTEEKDIKGNFRFWNMLSQKIACILKTSSHAPIYTWLSYMAVWLFLKLWIRFLFIRVKSRATSGRRKNILSCLNLKKEFFCYFEFWGPLSQSSIHALIEKWKGLINHKLFFAF